MKYRNFGKLDWEVSELSAGILRLEDVVDQRDIDYSERVAALCYAIDQGVNYINLGFPFYFEHPQEVCAHFKKALADGYREKVKLAVNVPTRDIQSIEDLDRSLDNQLKWFGIEKADFCILDWVYRETWDKLKALDVAAWAKEVINMGRADYIGFTFHDDAHYLKEINDSYPAWAVVQIELSVLDARHHPGVGGFAFTEQYGNAVIATDATKAGRLLRNIPTEVQKLWDDAEQKRTTAEWCLRWVLNLPEISSALIDFETIDQVKAYTSYIESFQEGDADIWETLRASKIRDAYYASRTVQCTACRCCMPCPSGIDVPRILELYNDCVVYNDDRIPKFLYNLEGHQNKKCVQCDLCEKNCPKHFPLEAIIDKATETLSKL